MTDHMVRHDGLLYIVSNAYIYGILISFLVNLIQII